MKHPHEIYDAASVRSGSTPLLKQKNGQNLSKNGSLSVSMRRLYSRWRRMHRYRFGVLFCAGLSATVFFINSILTIWAWKRFGVNFGVGFIQRGNCDQTKKLSQWLHLAINVLGTALLSASNYTMQCLSSPTRQDIDKAHAQNRWLDIGILSVRNLRTITWKRIILWWLLAVTSLPLHLMYNSAVFDTLSTHQYDVYVVSKDFLSGAPFKLVYDPLHLNPMGSIISNVSSEYFIPRLNSLRNLNSVGKLKNLTSKKCILTYGNVFAQSKYKDILAISSVNNTANSLLYLWATGRPYLDTQSDLWFCHGHEDEGFCNVADAANHAQDLTVVGHPIDYCLVQEVDEECMLQFSLPIMLIVIVCNLTKTACMICVVLEKKSQPLVTVGDAIASFLNEPDPATKNICLAGKDFFGEKGWQLRPLTWKFKHHRWFRAASMTRWLVCNVL